jgi:ricin-type beta-trefoil lectin protein
MTIRRFLKPALAPGRHRLAATMVVLAAMFAGAFMVAGSAHASSTFNPIISVRSGKCLDVRAEDGYYNPGARVQQYHCTGAQEQQWRLVLVPSPDGSFPSYEIISQRSGLCLGRGSDAFDGAQAIQMACSGANVVWFFISNGNGYFLRNTFDYRCLTVSGNSTADHALIQMWACDGSNAQLWRSNSFFPA